MHTKQTMAFVMEKHKTWLKFNHMEASIMEALDMLNELVDESDPDLDLPNIVHAFQTAERIREEHPDKECSRSTTSAAPPSSTASASKCDEIIVERNPNFM